MSGHNKWSKIKHKKASSDAERSRIFSKYSLLIAMESRKAHGNTLAPELSAVIERAKKDSMSKEAIERAVAKGAGTQTSHITEVLYETYGPGGVAIIINALTDNPNRTTPEIRHILSKNGYQLGTSGSALWAFSKNGMRYTPINQIPLNDIDGEALANLVEALEAHDEVQDVFTSVDEIE